MTFTDLQFPQRTDLVRAFSHTPLEPADISILLLPVLICPHAFYTTEYSLHVPVVHRLNSSLPSSYITDI